jgi:hypothetical protein
MSHVTRTITGDKDGVIEELQRLREQFKSGPAGLTERSPKKAYHLGWQDALDVCIGILEDWDQS